MPTRPGSSTLTPKSVQQMIVNTLYAFGISGKSKPPPIWYLDSRVSNHMTSSSAQLSSLKQYTGNHHIQTANGGKIPITAIGGVFSSIPLKNVFLYPSLTSNLLSIGQLVENNCNISVSSSSYVVQDQMLGKEIVREAKCGCLFPLDLSIIIRNKNENELFFFSVQNNCQLWHSMLGHPHFKTMSLVFNSGVLINSSRNISFDYDICKMERSKTLPFATSTSFSTECFELVHSDVWGTKYGELLLI